MEADAKYDYYPIAPADPSRPQATLMALSTNVMADWMPGIHNALAANFSELLGEMLKVEELDGDDLWIVVPRMTTFEKQWKLVTSWILGVAFCHRIIESLDYPFWAPVSAFNSRSGTIATPHWTFDYPPTNCVVEKRNKSILFPDYVVARAKAGGYSISFAESKGSKRSLENLAVAPTDWKNQSQNANFIFDGTRLPITQYLLIATRVYPFGKRRRTRRIQVRAWNSSSPDALVPFIAFRDVLVAHYFGICERVGLHSNAQLLALRNYSPTGSKERKQVLEVRARLSDGAHQELQREQLGESTIYIGPGTQKLKVGDKAIRVGLSEAAMTLVQSLQHRQKREDQNLVQYFERELASTRELVGSDKDIFLRSDGVIGFATKG